jgi:hypothetical protein
MNIIGIIVFGIVCLYANERFSRRLAIAKKKQLVEDYSRCLRQVEVARGSDGKRVKPKTNTKKLRSVI